MSAKKLQGGSPKVSVPLSSNTSSAGHIWEGRVIELWRAQHQELLFQLSPPPFSLDSSLLFQTIHLLGEAALTPAERARPWLGTGMDIRTDGAPSLFCRLGIGGLGGVELKVSADSNDWTALLEEL